MTNSFNRNVWLMFGLLSISTQSWCQVTHRVTGTLVTDTQSHPMEYAEVLVSDGSNNTVSSALTDEKGFFSLELKDGAYILKYRELGEILKQDTLNLNGDKDLGLIALPIANKTLQEMTVVGRRKIISFAQNKLIYSVKNSPYANGFSAKDVIINVPGINPTKPEEISLIGKEGVIVLLNGRKTNLSSKDLVNYLNNIPSENLDKIEVVTNPSSEYSASGNTGVINIILKDRMNLGWDGSLNAGYIQRHKGSLENGGNLSFSNNWVMMEYSVGYWKEKRIRDIRNSLDYPDYSKLINNESYQKSDYVSQNLNTNFFLNSKMNLGFLTSFNFSNDDAEANVYQMLSGSKNSIASEKTLTDSRYRSFSISPYYEWKFDGSGKKMVASYNYNTTKNKSNSDYSSADPLDVTGSMYDNRYYVNTYNLDFTLPFPWLNFKLGGEYSHYRAENYARYNTIDDFLYKETVGSFYTDVSKSWEKVFFKMGARYEYTKTKGFPQEEQNRFSRSYANWFPFVDLTYKPVENNVLYLGYSKRILRPEMIQLNPTRLYTDVFSYSVGNPLLNPALMDYLEFRYQYKTLNVGVSYVHTSDGIGLLVNNQANSQIVQTYSNCISSNSLTGNVSYNYSHNRFSAGAQLSVTYNKSKSSDKSLNDGSLEGFSTVAATNITYLLGSKTVAYATYMYCFPGMEQFIHYKSFQNLALGVNCNLMKNKLILNVSINDLLGTYFNRNHVVYEGFMFNNRIDNENRNLKVKLTYKFGNHKVKRSNVDVNSSNNRLPSGK